MKKIFLYIFFAVVFFIPSFCLTALSDSTMNVYKCDDVSWSRMTYEKKAFQILSRITTANNINQKFSIIIVRSYTAPNASMNIDYNVLKIENSLFNYIESDDELAAIISHEIGHAEHTHYGKRVATRILLTPLRMIKPTVCIARLISNKMNQPYETEADLNGIDYMVKAGYNPCAMETIMSKLSGDGMALLPSHPKGTVRLGDIHNYIAAKYPDFLFNPPAPPQQNITPVSNESGNNNAEPQVENKPLVNTTVKPPQKDITEKYPDFLSNNPTSANETSHNAVAPQVENKSLADTTIQPIQNVTNNEPNRYYLVSNNQSVKDFDYAKNTEILPYLKNIQSKVISKWYHANFHKSLTCKTLFTVNNFGVLTSLKLMSSSGNDVYDMACINAIKQAAPFKIFPEKYTEKLAEVQFSFVDYSITDPIVLMNLKTNTIHKPDCRLAKRSRESCIEIRKSEALARGGKLCKICR